MLLAQADQIVPGAMRVIAARKVELDRNGTGPFQPGFVSELHGADKVHAHHGGIWPCRVS